MKGIDQHIPADSDKTVEPFLKPLKGIRHNGSRLLLPVNSGVVAVAFQPQNSFRAKRLIGTVKIKDAFHGVGIFVINVLITNCLKSKPERCRCAQNQPSPTHIPNLTSHARNGIGHDDGMPNLHLIGTRRDAVA